MTDTLSYKGFRKTTFNPHPLSTLGRDRLSQASQAKGLPSTLPFHKKTIAYFPSLFQDTDRNMSQCSQKDKNGFHNRFNQDIS